MSTRKGSTPESGQDVLVLTGDITDYWSYTQIRDYLLLLCGLPPNALRLYLILRSMIAEGKRYRPGQGLRRMTIDQMCWLLTDDKPVSVSTMYGLLRALEKLDLLVPTDVKESEDGRRLKGKERAARGILRGFTVKDLPPDSFTGWRNAWDKLDAYQDDWRTNRPTPPTHLTELVEVDGRTVHQIRVQGSTASLFQDSGTGTPETPPNQDQFQDSGTQFQDSGTPFQEPGTDSPLTCGNGDPKEGPLRSSSLSGDAEAAEGGPTDGEREEQQQENREPTDAEQVLDAYEEALGGPALNGTRTKILADAAELLAARPLWWVIARARELPKYGTDLGKHAAMSTVPFAKKPPARPAGLPQEDPDYKPVQRDMSELRSILDAMRQPSI